MFVWFVATAVLSVWFVFSSPALDYRFVVVGSLVPLVEVPLGSPAVLHSVLAPVAALVAVGVVLPGQRLRQRRWVGVPIGMMFHLVFDGAWADTTAFWWPLTGGEFSDAELPVLGRGLALGLALEAVGVGLALWAIRTFGLNDPVQRRRFLRTGQLVVPS